MLTTYAQSTGPDGDLPPDGFLAACTWALANRDLWEKWVPKETDCSSGLGLVDLQQNFVTEVSAAVECATCPPGRASVKSGNTRVCSKCAAGSSQNLDCKNFEKYVGAIIPGLHHVVPLSQGMLLELQNATPVLLEATPHRKPQQNVLFAGWENMLTLLA